MSVACLTCHAHVHSLIYWSRATAASNVMEIDVASMPHQAASRLACGGLLTVGDLNYMPLELGFIADSAALQVIEGACV